jgi:hypothetical protein
VGAVVEDKAGALLGVVGKIEGDAGLLEEREKNA